MNLICGNIRTTKTGTKFVDILNEELFQTSYLEIIYIEDNKIVTLCDNILLELEEQIKKIIQTESNILCDEFFEIKYNDKTILWENGEYYTSNEINDRIKVGDKVRYIIKFKKIDIKNLKIYHEILQIEKKCV